MHDRIIITLKPGRACYLFEAMRSQGLVSVLDRFNATVSIESTVHQAASNIHLFDCADLPGHPAAAAVQSIRDGRAYVRPANKKRGLFAALRWLVRRGSA